MHWCFEVPLGNAYVNFVGSQKFPLKQDESIEEEADKVEPEDVAYGKCRWDFFLSRVLRTVDSSPVFAARF